MKLLLILFTVLIIGCSKQLQFAIKNDTQMPIKNVRVRLPDTTLSFAVLNPNSYSSYISIKRAYKYGPVEFVDSLDRRYGLRVIDYVGEKPYIKGYLTFIIQSIDTNTRHFKLNYEYTEK